MRYVVTGRLREPCPLSAEEYFALAVREWQLVLEWIARGKAVAYGGFGSAGGGAILLDAASEADARARVQALPLAPYAELTVSPFDPRAPGLRPRTLLLGVPVARP